MLIKNLQDEKYKLATDSQEVADMADGLGFNLQDCGGLLYCFDIEGDYISEVWGFSGIVPILSKPVQRLL